MRIIEKKVSTKTGQELLLRSPEECHSKALLSFLRILFRESSDNMNGRPDRFDKTTEEEQSKTIRDELLKNSDFFLSAFTDDGSIVGNLSFRKVTTPSSQHCGELGLGVLKQYQNCGVGSALLRHCIDTAKELGIWNIKFTVRTYNAAGIQLYEKMGFQRVGLLKAVALVDDRYCDEYLYQGVFR